MKNFLQMFVAASLSVTMALALTLFGINVTQATEEYTLSALNENGLDITINAGEKITIITSGSIHTNPYGTVSDCDIWTDANGIADCHYNTSYSDLLHSLTFMSLIGEFNGQYISIGDNYTNTFDNDGSLNLIINDWKFSDNEGTLSLSITRATLTAPTLTITEPDGLDDTTDTTYTITWTDEDPEEDATISLYYDTDNTGADGILITDNISEDDETDSYTWDTSGITEGNYYLYAVIDDGVNEAVVSYSSGMVTVSQSTANIILEDDFNDGVIDANLWTTSGSSVVEEDGVLRLSNDVTDGGGSAASLEFTPTSHIRVEARHKMHTSNSYYFPKIALYSDDYANSLNLRWQKSSYSPDYCNDSTLHNKVFLNISAYGDVCSLPSSSYSNLTSSDYYDIWITSIIEYNSETGEYTLDNDGDGTIDFSVTIDLDLRSATNKIYFGNYGWWTGHTHEFDWVKVTDLSYTSNTPPTLNLTEPDGLDDTADTSYTITWTDEDPEEDALISLYYDTDNTGTDGTLITDNISEDDETDSYTWDTTGVGKGAYYIYAVIDDGVNEAVVSYSSGAVTVTTLAGQGTATDPYLLQQCADLADLAENESGVTAYFQLQNDLDCSEVNLSLFPIQMTDIVLNGNNQTLRNFTQQFSSTTDFYYDTADQAYYLGIFGKVTNFTVNDLVLDNIIFQKDPAIDLITLEQNELPIYLGFLGGLASDSIFENVTIQNSTIDLPLGLAENAGEAVLNNPLTAGLLGGSMTGGSINNTTLTNSTNTISFEQNGAYLNNEIYLGGLVGATHETSLTAITTQNVAVAGNGDSLGGLVGFVDGGVLNGVTLTQASLTADGAYAGAVVGKTKIERMENISISDNSTIHANHWTGSLVGNTQSNLTLANLNVVLDLTLTDTSLLVSADSYYPRAGGLLGGASAGGEILIENVTTDLTFTPDSAFTFTEQSVAQIIAIVSSLEEPLSLTIKDSTFKVSKAESLIGQASIYENLNLSLASVVFENPDMTSAEMLIGYFGWGWSYGMAGDFNYSYTNLTINDVLMENDTGTTASPLEDFEWTFQLEKNNLFVALDSIFNFKNFVASNTTTDYTVGEYVPLYLTLLAANAAPTLTFLEPDGLDDTADTTYEITWTDEDPDSEAVIALYYDPDNSNADGILIVENLQEDDETDAYTWETTEIPAGNYYLYAVIEDGVNEAVVSYSSGPVTIDHNNTHFTPIWTGEPYESLNLLVKRATLNGLDLEANDEIAIFDEGKCVGVGVVTATLSEENYLTIVTSKDDGEGQGFTAGNVIRFKIWDSSAARELRSPEIQAKYFDLAGNLIAPPTFSGNADYVVTLNAEFIQ